MNLSWEIKKYLFESNDGAFVNDLKKTFKTSNSDILGALASLGSDVILADDGRWYLEKWAKMEEPVDDIVAVYVEPKKPVKAEKPVVVVENPVVVTESIEMMPMEYPVAVETPQTVQEVIIDAVADQQPISSVPQTTNAQAILDWLAAERKEGRGPYTYHQVAEMMNIRLSSVRSSKRTIYSKHPEEVPTWEAMMVIADPMANLKKAPSHVAKKVNEIEDRDVGAYRWKLLSGWLARAQEQQRGPFDIKTLRQEWSPIASLRQVRRAVAVIKTRGSIEDRDRVEKMVIPEIFDVAKDIPSFMSDQPASPCYVHTVLSDNPSIEEALNEIRSRLSRKPAQASRWKQTLEGLDTIMDEFGVPADHLTRLDLQAMAAWLN